MQQEITNIFWKQIVYRQSKTLRNSMDNKREFNKRGASSFYNNLIVNIVCRILFL